MMTALFTRIILICSFVLVGMLHMSDSAIAGPIIGIQKADVTSKLNDDASKVIDSSSIKGNPITNGSDAVVGKTSIKGKISGIITIDNTSYTKILGTTTQKIQSVVDWSLGLLAIICLIYLVYQGIILLTKFNDDKAQGEALSSIKTVAWAIGGIGLAWFIVSAGFYIVSKFAV